jgi:hypothetical protein
LKLSNARGADQGQDVVEFNESNEV